MTETQPCTPEQKNTLTACQLLDTVVRPAVFWPQPVWEFGRFAFPGHVSWHNAHWLPPTSTPWGGERKGPCSLASTTCSGHIGMSHGLGLRGDPGCRAKLLSLSQVLWVKEADVPRTLPTGFPGGSVAKTEFPMQRAQVQFLVKEPDPTYSN